jgi:muramoyltetrapeptide carboxypeptidase LdcA involved in peptidoglycan recycling
MPINPDIAKEILERQITERLELDKMMVGSGDPDTPQKWARICKDNLEFITDIVTKHGWPRADLFQDEDVGKVVEYAAWMCVQHGDSNSGEWSIAVSKLAPQELAPDEAEKRKQELQGKFEPALIAATNQQKLCLAVMAKDDAAKHHIAFVTDRIARNKCEPQIYATQGVPHPLDIGAEIEKRVRDGDVNQRRNGMGLESCELINEYNKQIAAGTADKGIIMPPAIRDNDNITSYRQKQEGETQEYVGKLQLKDGVARAAAGGGAAAAVALAGGAGGAAAAAGAGSPGQTFGGGGAGKLKEGDKITIIYYQDPTPYLKRNKRKQKPGLCEMFEEKGLLVNHQNYKFKDGSPLLDDPGSYRADGYHIWADKPENFVDYLITQMRDRDVKAVFLPNGGSGIIEAIDLLEQKRVKGELPERDDILWLGFSDTEKLCSYFGQFGYGQAFTVPKDEDLLDKGIEERDKDVKLVRDNLFSVLFDGKEQERELTPVNDQAKRQEEVISGDVVGGSINNILQNKQGYNRIEIREENILYLENQDIAGIEKTLLHYIENGQLGNCSAIIINKYAGQRNELDERGSVERIKELCLNHGITKPLYFGLPSGHNKGIDKDTIAMPFCSNITITHDGGKVTAKLSPFRTQEQMADLRKYVTEREYIIAYEETVDDAAYNPQTITIAADSDASSLEPGEYLVVPVQRTPNGNNIRNCHNILREAVDKKDLIVTFPNFFSHTAASQDGYIHAMYVNAIQSTLMDFKSSGNMDKVKSLTINCPCKLPEEVKSWLADFNKRHQIEINLSVSKNPALTYPKDIDIPRMKEEVAATVAGSGAAAGAPPLADAPAIDGEASAAEVASVAGGGAAAAVALAGGAGGGMAGAAAAVALEVGAVGGMAGAAAAVALAGGAGGGGAAAAVALAGGAVGGMAGVPVGGAAGGAGGAAAGAAPLADAPAIDGEASAVTAAMPRESGGDKSGAAAVAAAVSRSAGAVSPGQSGGGGGAGKL